MANIGKITQIIGPVVDVSFEDENATLPNILDALEIDRPTQENRLSRLAYIHHRRITRHPLVGDRTGKI